jgi:hypothetical protein
MQVSFEPERCNLDNLLETGSSITYFHRKWNYSEAWKYNHYSG